MNLLAIETSSQYCSIALQSGQRVYHRSQVATREQSRLILPFIDAVLKEAAITLKDLTAIALSIGPGSFTGLRLAMGVTQGLAFSLNIPVIPVSSLAVWAQAVYRQTSEKNLLIAINAHMGEHYVGEYMLQEGVMVAVKPDRLEKPESVKVQPTQRLVTDEDKILPDALALIDIALQGKLNPTVIEKVSLNYLRDESAWKTVENQ